MNIEGIDGSNYRKGQPLLVRKDRKITEPEVRLMRHVGATLGFEPGFCDNAIREIPEHKYIVDAPSEFTTKELTEKFVKTWETLPFPPGSGRSDRRALLTRWLIFWGSSGLRQPEEA